MNKHAIYEGFLGSLGVSDDELNTLLAEEANNLPAQELETIKAADLARPESWTPAQQQIFMKLFARATMKANDQHERS